MANGIGAVAEVLQQGGNPGSLSSSTINPYEPGTSLPGVPRTGGANTQTDMLMAMLQKNNANEQARYYLMADARSRATTAIAMKALGGSGNAQKWMQSDEGKLAGLAVSTMINSGLGGMLNTGGNILDLAAGLGNVAASGMSAQFQGGGGGMFAGRGAMTDAVTKSMFDRVYGDFYGGMGAANLHKTHGLDMGQMGTVMTRLAQSGAFAGLNSGTMTQDAQGKWGHKLNEDTITKVMDMASTSAATIRQLQDITGSKDVAETMRLASSLTGMSFSDPNAARQMGRQISHISDTAGTLGLNAGALMSDMQARGGGPIAQTAVLNTASVISNNQIARNQAMKNGQYVPELDRQKMTDISQAGITAAAMQEKDVNGALWLLQNSDMVKGHEAEVIEQIRKVGEAGTSSSKATQRAALRGMMNQYTPGVSLTTLNDQLGGAAGILPGLSAEYKALATQTYDAADRSELFQKNINSMNASFGGDRSREMRSGTSMSMWRNAANFVTADKREDFLYSLEHAGEEGVTPFSEYIQNSPGGTPAQRAEAIESFSTAVKQYGGKNVAGGLREFTGRVSGNPFLAGYVGDADRARQRTKEDTEHLDKIAFGVGTGESKNPIEMLARGIAQGLNVTDQVAVQQIANEDKDKPEDQQRLISFEMERDKDGNWVANNMSEGAAAKLAKIEGMAGAAGLQIDADLKGPEREKAIADKLKDAAKDPETLRKIRQHMELKGMGININQEDGNKLRVDAATRGDTDASTKVVEKNRLEDIQKTFNVKDEAELAQKFDKDPKERERLLAIRKKGDKASEKEKHDLTLYDSYAAKNKDIEIQSIDKQLAEQEQVSRSNSGFFGILVPGNKADADSKIKDLKEEKAKLLDPSKGGSDMIGRVRLVDDQGILLDLWKAGGGR